MTKTFPWLMEICLRHEAKKEKRKMLYCLHLLLNLGYLRISCQLDIQIF